MNPVEQLKKSIVENYEKKTPASKKCNQEAVNYIPSGDTRAISYYEPYPIYGDRGSGYTLYDYDDNAYIDMLNCMTTLIHGHAHPKIVAAMIDQTAKGCAPAIPSESQYKLAEMICKRTPSVDKVRFTNTGSEAVLFAMRIARAYTDRDVIVKIDGGYHGSSDYAQVNQIPDIFNQGPPQRFLASRGIPERIIEDMRVVEFNDLPALEKVFGEEKEKIAAVILEPVLGAGGGVGPEDGYLEGIRELTQKHDSLMIFDEIITYRLSEGGMQKKAGVKPDLTTFGKIIGGGMPIGALGGREDIMTLFDPRAPGNVNQSGTFTGNALAMAAGCVSLELLDQAEIDRIDALGEKLYRLVQDRIDAVGIDVNAGTNGSMMAICPNKKSMKTSRDAVSAYIEGMEFMKYFHLELLNLGVTCLSRGLFSISTPMDDAVIEDAANRIGDAIEHCKPIRDALKN